MKALNLFLFLFLFITAPLFAQNRASVEVNPISPLKDENFQLIFTIPLSGDETPRISFNPGGTEVLGRKMGGTSLSTTIINGKVSTKKEVTYIYELVSYKSGNIRLSDIEIDYGNRTEKLNDIRINILSKRKEGTQFFVMTDVSNKSPYIGEAITVNYYIFFKARENVMNHEILKFPELNNFIKRFHMPNNDIETVEFDGLLYKRKLAYSARLYPEKEGKMFIDPLKIRIQYLESSRPNIGSFFSMGLGRYKIKELSGKRVEVNVRPIPVENMPSDFSGLVGEHEFKLTTNREKYLVNEAIELKLVVEGLGALEKFDAPSLLKDPTLEEFDKKGSFEELDEKVGRKTFEYTYLARAANTFNEKIISISIFDPEKGIFVRKEIKVPSISIAGNAVAGESGQYSPKKENNSESANIPTSTQKKEFNSTGIVAPDFTPRAIQGNWIRLLNLLILASMFGVLFLIGKDQLMNGKLRGDLSSILAEMKKGKINYSNIYKIIIQLKENSNGDDNDLQKIVDHSNLSNSVKEYLKSLIKVCEENHFSNKKGNSKPIYNENYFKEVVNELKNKSVVKSEDSLYH